MNTQQTPTKPSRKGWIATEGPPTDQYWSPKSGWVGTKPVPQQVPEKK